MLGLFSKNVSNVTESNVSEKETDFTSFLDNSYLEFTTSDFTLDNKEIVKLENELNPDIFENRGLKHYFESKGVFLSLIDPEYPHYIEGVRVGILVSSKENMPHFPIGRKDDKRSIYFIFKKSYGVEVKVESTILSSNSISETDILTIRKEFISFVNLVMSNTKSLLVTVPKFENVKNNFDNILSELKINKGFELNVFKSIAISTLDKMKELELAKLKEDFEKKYKKNYKWVNSY